MRRSAGNARYSVSERQALFGDQRGRTADDADRQGAGAGAGVHHDGRAHIKPGLRQSDTGAEKGDGTEEERERRSDDHAFAGSGVSVRRRGGALFPGRPCDIGKG